MDLLEAFKADLAPTAARRYYDDPVAFVHDCINWKPGQAPTDYQLEALAAIPQHRRVSVRGPHGLGKTGLNSWVILWFALTREAEGVDWKVPTTASVWRQLTKFLWPEVRKWSRSLNWDVLERDPFTKFELQQLNLKLHYGEAFAVASDEPSAIEGAHADEILYVFDESKAIRPDTFDAAEGAFSSGEAYAIANSTPGEPNGRFYEIQSRKPGFEDWHAIHVTLEDAISAGRITREWADQRRKQWTAESAVYKNRVEGDFASSDEDGVIPLAWVEAAQERWRDRHYDCDNGHSDDCYGRLFTIGVDVARSGQDKTVMALRRESEVVELRSHSKEDTMQTTGRVMGIQERLGGKAIVDVIGIGAGVVDRLKEKKRAVVPFNASEGTKMKDTSGELGFINCRSAAWWHLRELLDPASGVEVSLPPSDELTGDLVAPKWKVTSGGKIQVEGKDDIRKRLGRSTDDGDAVVMAFWEGGRRSLSGVPGPGVVGGPSKHGAKP